MPKQRAKRSGSLRQSARRPRHSAASEPFVAEVRDLASDGRGIVAAPDGRVTFVPGVWPGEQVRVVVRSERGRVVEGELLEVLRSHPGRREPPCPHQGYKTAACGGCPWQFMDYRSQLAAKQQRLARTVDALPGGGLAAPRISVLPAPAEWEYRNRAQLKSDGERLGYVALRSRSLVDVTTCPILTPFNQAKLRELRNALPVAAWRPSRSRAWTTLDIDDERSEVLINQRQPFRQGNTAQNAVMQAWLRDQLASSPPSGKILELFAGSGNFTAVLADSGLPVVAAEVADAALQGLLGAELPNLSVEPCDLFDSAAAAALAARHSDTQILVLDPPRDGFTAREAVLPVLESLERVLYISCDLATWQRDVEALLQHGFVLDDVSLVDLFPQTPHLEVLSALSRAR